jgi:uncharacterized surface protein with fasciclin (FAS1) repeats
MKNSKLILSSVLIAASMFCNQTFAQTMDKNVKVGGEAMYPTKNIIENALNSNVHTTLVAAVKAAGLVETLQGKGPFTVFAPTNDAFENLPEGTVETKVLTYHVLRGNYNFEELKNQIKKSGGKATIPTVSGGTLMFTMNGEKNISVWDENGNGANISVYDVKQSNGVIHVIDAVVLPKM